MAGRSRVSAVAVLAMVLGLLAATVGPGHAVEPEDFTGDTEAPKAVSFTVTPVAGDVTNGSASFAVTARITDNFSGIHGGSVGWQVAGNNSVSYSAFFTRTAGTDRDGTYTATITIPRYSAQGSYPLDLQAYDRVGNSMVLWSADLQARGWTSALLITDANPDDTPPRVTDIKLTPSAIDVRTNDVTVVVDLTLVDDQSGADQPFVTFDAPDGTPGGTRPPSFSVVSGTRHNGVWRGSVAVPRYAPAGRWKLNVRLYDELHNVVEIPSAQLAEKGLVSGFDVVSDEDTKPPVLVEYSMLPFEVNVHDADQPVAIRVRVTDDKSGLAEWEWGEAIYEVQASAQDFIHQQYGGTGLMKLASGTRHDGVYEGTITIPKSSATGLRPISVWANDNVHNNLTAEGDALVAAGGMPVLLVYNTPLPPLPLGADPLDGGAVVRWDPPTDDRGAEVTEYVVEEQPQGKVATVGGDARSATMAGLTNDVRHTFTVKAVNKAGPSDASGSVGATPKAGLGSPGPGSGSEPPKPGPGLPTTDSPAKSGYWMVGADGQVYPFGDARSFGRTWPSAGASIVDIEPTPARDGYWVVDSVGEVWSFGAARWLGDAGGLWPGESVRSMSATPNGGGYWLFTSRGRVLPFGNAPHLGDMAGVALNGPVLDSVPTPTGGGYYMVASDGGVFAFGDAGFAGSMGGRALNRPVESLVPDADGRGYWLVASDGGVFAFDAAFLGSMGSVPLNRPVTGMVGSRTGRGYLMVGEDGGIFSFGDVPFRGSLGSTPPAVPITAVAAY